MKRQRGARRKPPFKATPREQRRRFLLHFEGSVACGSCGRNVLMAMTKGGRRTNPADMAHRLPNCTCGARQWLYAHEASDQAQDLIRQTVQDGIGELLRMDSKHGANIQ